MSYSMWRIVIGQCSQRVERIRIGFGLQRLIQLERGSCG